MKDMSTVKKAQYTLWKYFTQEYCRPKPVELGVYGPAIFMCQFSKIKVSRL